MRTETKIIKIYKFDELSKDIQENLIEKEKEYQLDAYCECFLLEDMQEEAKSYLKTIDNKTKEELKNGFYKNAKKSFFED